LSATGGLAWLACNCPKFAFKLLLGLLICNMLIMIGLQSYRCGYKACQSSISRGLSQGLHGFRLPSQKKIALNRVIAAKIRSTASEIENTMGSYGFYLNVASAILLGLMLFAILIDNNKTNKV
jgi:hypothetical protein